ncbi:hypothetical protein IFM89_033897 [Coptis chinensis]|uniref:DNA repair metallo-beta-lactamase domain-containing protein n=1 Tax=Coptis chinensis TaxID=261450 RepID=A0A835GZC1_9MAGN|nr:hypothetical protein IFM89_033897 [Coptis chinensis]
MHPTIGIMPSGLPWVVRPFEENGCSLGFSHFIFHDRSKITNSSDIAHRSQQAEVSGSVRKFHHCIYSVPYSDHSCFNELQEFINLLQPLTMKGIVSSSSCDTDPHNFLGNLCGLKQTIEQSSKKFQRRKVNGNAETVQVKPVTGRDKSVDVKLESERYMKPRVSWKRVRVIRRLRQGAKIVGYINID